MPLFTKSSTWQSDEHQMFADMAARFYQDELVPRIDTWNANGVVERAFWTKAGAAGLMGGSIDEAYGGVSGGMGFDAVALYEQAAVGDSGAPFVFQAGLGFPDPVSLA